MRTTSAVGGVSLKVADGAIAVGGGSLSVAAGGGCGVSNRRVTGVESVSIGVRNVCWQWGQHTTPPRWSSATRTERRHAGFGQANDTGMGSLPGTQRQPGAKKLYC